MKNSSDKGEIGKRMTITAFLWVIVLMASCSPGELKIDTVEFCDNYNSQTGQCSEKREPHRTYRPEIPSGKQSSWYDFAYHMYFHTRETPGLRVVLNRPMNEREMDRAGAHMLCSYTIRKGERSASGTMEGFRISDDRSSLWCFDYLGTMLLTYHKKFESIEQTPDPEFFPVELEIAFSNGSSIQGSRRGTVDLEWQSTGGQQQR